MPLSNAERQRRFREKRRQDAQKREDYRSYEKQKYLNARKSGSRKAVTDMTVQEQRQSKKKWKEHKQLSRERQRQRTELQSENICSQLGSSGGKPRHELISHQKLNFYQSSVRSIEKMSLEISKLKEELFKEKTSSAKYRKRLQRICRTPCTDSPLTKARHIIKGRDQQSVKCRKNLTFHFAVVDELANKNHQSKSLARKLLSSIASSKVLKKYKMQSRFRKCMALANKTGDKYKKILSLTERQKTSLTNFFSRIEVAQKCPGKKQTITRNKLKKQRSTLKDTLRNLYKKYVSETGCDLSFTSFWRSKPFWITMPRNCDRNTCLCKVCENVKFVSNCLFINKIIKSNHLSEIIRETICDQDNKDCMYGECKKCKHLSVALDVQQSIERKATFFQWENVNEKRIINGTEKIVNFVKKSKKTSTLIDILSELESRLPSFKIHIFNVKNQYQHYEKLMTSSNEKECLIHVDFAENYNCKYSSEVQSAHYGCSKGQVSLHTGFYKVGKTEGVKTFCGISDSLRHDPASIWTYLNVALDYIKARYPSVEMLHFFSDGPCSQYRQKQNFFLFSKLVFLKGFQGGSWNFHEAGHGKGIPDGVGATIKRAGDSQVKYGRDVRSASDF